MKKASCFLILFTDIRLFVSKVSSLYQQLYQQQQALLLKQKT